MKSNTINYVVVGAFVLAMLATVTFGGLVETAAWAGFLEFLSGSDGAKSFLLALRDAGFDLLATIKRWRWAPSMPASSPSI